ncbi:MAG: HAD family hydrolase [Velocimicrobium sp.]
MMNQVEFLENDIYFFDIFDTIVKRKVEPEYVKKLWCKEIKKRCKINSSIENIYNIRNEKECHLCKENEKNGFDQEFKYESLLNELYTSYGLDGKIDKSDFNQIAYNSELNCELLVQSVCEDTLELLKELKKRNKKIICITDFYMPKVFLEQLFEYHGIKAYIDKFFVSSEYLMTKRSGSLYRKVLQEFPIAGKKYIMIGDNRYSDIEMAQRFGFSTKWLDRSSQEAYYRKMENQHKRDVKATINTLYNNVNRSNYEDISFSLYQYIEKLYYYLLNNKVRNVFFLSREGEFLKKLFEQYQQNRVEKINTHYFMVSRKATFMASLEPLESETFEMIFRQYIHISLYDFLMSLGFQEMEIIDIAKELNIDYKTKEEDFPRSVTYDNLLKNDTFCRLYESRRTEQKNNFLMYIHSFGVDIEKEGMYLVDVGWKGTIQDNIFKFLDEKIEVVGLYLGLVALGKKHVYNRKVGLVFQCTEGRSTYFNVYNENKSIFEIILGASHGSADSYIRIGDEIQVKTAEQEKEAELFRNLISPIQSHIYSIFKELKDELEIRKYDIDGLEETWAHIHANMVYFPTKDQIELFYKIYHFENFGVFEFTKFKTQDKLSLLKRVNNLRLLIKDHGKFFATSFWGVIALKDAGLSFLIKVYGKYKYKRYFMKERENNK